MASFKKLKSGWQYRVSYKEGGKYKTKSQNGFSTKKEAQLAAAKVEKKLNGGFNVNENPVFTDYFQEWFELFKKGKHSSRNDKDIEHSINVARKFFKLTKIKEIDRALYQKFVNWYGENRSKATVKKVHIYTKMCLEEALHDGLISKNPTHRIIVEGTKPKQSDEAKFISRKETTKLIQALKKDLQPSWISRYMILLSIATGLRFSEVLGLTWEDVNFEDKTIRVNKSFDHVVDKTIAPTKTESSNRTIIIDDETVLMLKQYKLSNQHLYPNYVFIDKLGNYVSNTGANKALRKACKRAGIKSITFHHLRHAHCSLLIHEGFNIKYISKRLGHSNIGTTYDIYGHIIDEMEQKQNNKINEVMSVILH